MRSRGKRYSFGPAVLARVALVPIAAAVVLMTLFIALGIWQLNRAEEKQAILDSYARRSQQPPVALALPLVNAEHWRYRHVEITGRFDSDHQFLLDNQVRAGQAGYHVLTPLRVNGGKGLLVDRGWIPSGANRGRLPEIPVTDARIALRGTIYVPYEQGFRLGGMDAGEIGWPRRVQFVDFKRMGARLDLALAGASLRLDPESSYCYRCEWQVAPFTPERHLGYAVQWFAMAFALLIIVIVVNVNRNKSSNESKRG